MSSSVMSLRDRGAGPISWIILAMVTCLVMTWCIGWGRYAATWSDPRFVSTGDGEFVTTPNGDLRITAIRRADTLPDHLDQVQQAPPGATFVVVVFEFRPHVPQATCDLSLVAADRVLSGVQATTLPNVSGCAPDQAGPGALVWTVPAQWADQVTGVAVPSGRYGRLLLLRP